MLPLAGERKNAKGILYEKSESNDVSRGTSTLKRGFAHMLKNGVVMDVTTVEQAQIAEEAGAVSVMVLDKLPSDVRKAGGVARTASIRIIEDIMDSVTIPVMAKCRIGHIVEAQVLESLEVDFIDESEVLTPADNMYHINKWPYKVPFVCGCRNLGEALRRILVYLRVRTGHDFSKYKRATVLRRIGRRMRIDGNFPISVMAHFMRWCASLDGSPKR